MKMLMRRTLVPTLVVAVSQLAVLSMPVVIPRTGWFSKDCLLLALFMMTSFAGGAVHAVLLRRRSDAGLSACFLDGAMIGLLSNLVVQIPFIGASVPLMESLVPRSSGADPGWWISFLVLSSVIVLIYAFTGLVLGGMGGGLVGLVSRAGSGNKRKSEGSEAAVL